jgi:membrane associated rhomboid family serine protease
MMRITETVKQLIIINIMFFVGSYLVGEPAERLMALHAVQSDDFKVWQLLTHMFMHGGLMHILFNMFALFSFGGLLENIWGAKKFIFFYISCGLGAAALHLGISYLELQNMLHEISYLNLPPDIIHKIMNVPVLENGRVSVEAFNNEVPGLLGKYAKEMGQPEFQTLFDVALKNQIPMVGASGAIYGLLVAFAFMFPNVELMMMFIPLPIKAKYFVPGILTLDLFLGLKGQSIFGFGDDGVAHFAHIGGALIGFIMMWYWKKNQFNQNRWN